jgi:hypothetical protein
LVRAVKKRKRELETFRDEENFIPMFQQGRAKEDAYALSSPVSPYLCSLLPWLSPLRRLSVRDDSRGLMGDVALDLMSDDKQTMLRNKNALRYAALSLFLLLRIQSADHTLWSSLRWDRKRKRFVSAASLEAKEKKGGFKFKNESGTNVDGTKKVSMYVAHLPLSAGRFAAPTHT